MEFFIYIAAGALVGFAVGLTGVGGGSLMTPLLLLFGYPAPVAIGTDLLYASITKSSGVYIHHRQHSVSWRIVMFLALGSIPTSILLNLFVLDAEFRANEQYENILTTTLGIMLIVTAVVIVFQSKIQQRLNNGSNGSSNASDKKTDWVCLVVGILLGVCVTLSSVGAGAFGAAVLFILYPRLKAVSIVGTDIAHAVPLTLVAGLGYLYHGLVDFKLLGSLICGSLPGIYLGSHMGAKLPDLLLRGILVTALLGLGIYFSYFQGH